ncbi:hypothetical protein [Dyadobacter crusticola]|uniref:hypothetical protein n=1 Tax=Dyadobacter crusticola TaxID=292407 RepID=UPI0004E0E21E|nr:hypothetical protein [Dyadobacter crusticola]
MLKTCLALLFSVFLMISCKKSEDKTEPAQEQPGDNDLTGTYQGYKFFNKSRKDSLAVTMKVSRIAEQKLDLEEITPFNHIKHLEMNGADFTYDRGTGEDGCGRISMKGTGNFKGKQLYLIETITCVRGNGPDKFVEYRVTKI